MSHSDVIGGEVGGLAHEPTPKAQSNQVATRLVVGESYHVYGWNFKAVFKLVSVAGNVATLITPKTRRITHAPINKLFYTKYSKRKLSQQLSEARASKEVRKNAKEEL